MTSSDIDSPYFTVTAANGEAVGVFCVSRLTEEQNIEQFGHDLFNISDRLSCKRIALDLSTLQYITSSCIGKLISLHRRLDREGGKLALCGIQGELEMILGTARLLTYFHIAPDLPAARALLATNAANG